MSVCLFVVASTVIVAARRKSQRIAALAALALLPALVARPALADSGGNSRRIEKRLAKGKALFDDQEYKKAIRKLEPVADNSKASTAQRVRALELIGLSHLILERRSGARKSFEALLALEPGHKLEDDFGSEKIRRFYTQVRHEYLAVNGPALLEHTPPESARGGRKVDISVHVSKGSAVVKELFVMLHRPGEKYRAVQMRPRGDDRWRARLALPGAKKPYKFKYYIEGRDIAGRAIAWHGSAQYPVELSVDAGSNKRAWYKRWYVIMGGVAVIAVGAAIVAATSDSQNNQQRPVPSPLLP